MRTRGLTAQRLGVLGLAVVALHFVLIGSVADRLAAVVPPHAVHASAGLAVRTLDPAPRRAAQDASAVPARPAPRSAAATPHDAARDRARRAAPLPAHPAPTSARTATPSADVAAAPAGVQPPAMPAAVPIGPEPAAAVDASVGRAAPPIYPVLAPPAFAFAYRLTRGAVAGEVELRWQPDGDRYAASLEGRGGGDGLPAWRSTGGFDAAGIAPGRFVDHRRGRGALAVNFQRDAGKVTFSGPQIEHVLAPGVQDRLSWMLQLAAIAAADPVRIGASGAAIGVVGVRGDADVWRFEPMGTETLDLAEGPVAALHLLRRPERVYDTRAEVWLAPSLHFLPLRVRLSNGGETLQLEWRAGARVP